MRASAAVGSCSRRAVNSSWSGSRRFDMSHSVVFVRAGPCGSFTRGEHRTLDVREDLPSMFQKQSPSARQPYPSCAAIEQPGLDLFLQLLDLLTERRLRDVEALR